MSEARQLAERRLREIATMPLEDLVGFIEGPTDSEVSASSGRTYRVRTYSFWDMDPYDSDLFARVKVTGRGLRAHERYIGVEVRGPEDEFATRDANDVDISATWTEVLPWTVLGLLVAALLFGVGYLASKAL